MLTNLCQELKNWFDRYQPHIMGKITISEGKITNQTFLNAVQENQYFRIRGSVFNDGVHQFTPNYTLKNEEFDGVISLMAIPEEVISLAAEIDAWIAKYGDAVLSPFTSESFGGYSYSKGANGGGSGNKAGSWQGAFADRLNRWRKI